MRNLYRFVIPILLLSSCDQSTPSVYVTNEGAINGYDPVAYFESNAPLKGEKRFTTVWNNASWYFATEKNLQAFKNNPERYAPQYGGYCAYGAAEGHKASTDAEAWTIVNDKLYLNYNLEVQRLWLPDKLNLIEKADSNWVVLKETR